MNKQKFFKNSILEICRKTKTTMPVITKDNRLGKNYVAEIFSGICTKTQVTKHFMRYNAKLLDKMPKNDIIHAICHELGHIRNDAKTRVNREYKAELFALKIIKKYYPKDYRNAIKFVKVGLKFHDTVYPTAFAKVLRKINE